MQQCAQMGFDLYQCQDFLEMRGLCEEQFNNLVDNLNNPNFVNVLKLVQQPMIGVQPVMMQAPAGMNPMAAMMGNQMVGQVNAMHAQQQQFAYNYQP